MAKELSNPEEEKKVQSGIRIFLEFLDHPEIPVWGGSATAFNENGAKAIEAAAKTMNLSVADYMKLRSENLP